MLGRGRETILQLFALTAWCVSADTDPTRGWWGSRSVISLCSSSTAWLAGSGERQPLHVCAAARRAGSGAGTALVLSVFYIKQILPKVILRD